jgi:hypothetical protein
MTAAEIRHEFNTNMHNKLEIEKVAQLAELNELLKKAFENGFPVPSSEHKKVTQRAELVSR